MAEAQAEKAVLADAIGQGLAHAKLSASGSSMWLNCTGSRRMNEGKPDETSIFAAEGTVAHSLGEYCLKHDVIEVAKMIGNDMLELDDDLKAGIRGVEVDTIVSAEMADYVQVYVDYVRSFFDFDSEIFIEERVDFSPWVPEGFGTADAIVVNGDTVEIIDLKYGKGVAVSAFENTQGMMYGLGVINNLSKRGINGIEHINIHIVQPRLDNISEYHVTKGQLLHWGEKTVRPKAIEAMTDVAPLTAGEKQCLWCKAKGDCVAFAHWSLEKAVDGFEFIEPDMQTKRVDTLTPEQYAMLFPQLKSIKNWVGAVEDRVLDLLQEGTDIPGYKVVEGRSNRRWIDEALVVPQLLTKLKDNEIHDKKLKTPTQIEKLIGKSDPLMKKLVEKPKGNPTVAHESDKRPAIHNRTAGFEFETPKS